MKWGILLILTLSNAFAANPAGPKYTEEQFIKKVAAEVKLQVDKIKNKSVTDLTKELVDKDEKIRLQELELQKKEDQLKTSEVDLGKKYAEFESRQKAFIGCVQKNEDEAKGRISQLVEMVSNMKPQKAAEVLAVQEADIAVKILQMIDAKKASKIFNFMDKEVSARLQKQYLDMKK